MPFSLTGSRWDIYSSEYTPLNSVNVINVSNAIFNYRKRISVYQALSLRAGYQANLELVNTACVRCGNKTSDAP